MRKDCIVKIGVMRVMLHIQGYRNIRLYCSYWFLSDCTQNCMSTEFSDSPHYKTAGLQSSVTVHTTKLHVYTVRWQSTLQNCMSTEFSDSPHYKTACLHSSVTVHTTKLHVYTVQWQSTLQNCMSTQFSDSPNYKTACLQSLVTVHTTNVKKTVYRVSSCDK